MGALTATERATETQGRAAPVVAAQGVSRRFGPNLVLRPTTLTIQPGERLALLGPNGAGKTTLLRMLMTLLQPSSGTLRLFGLDPRRDGEAVRARLGVVGHQTFLHPELTAAENLRYAAALYDLPDSARRGQDALAEVGLAARAGDRVRGFSRGMQQRLALARALLPNPDLLLLDEPDAGLDIRALDLLPDLMAPRAGTSRTIIFTTHQVERALELASRVLVLVAGRLVYDGPAARLTPRAVAALYGGSGRAL